MPPAGGRHTPPVKNCDNHLTQVSYFPALNLIHVNKHPLGNTVKVLLACWRGSERARRGSPDMNNWTTLNMLSSSLCEKHNFQTICIHPPALDLASIRSELWCEPFFPPWSCVSSHHPCLCPSLICACHPSDPLPSCLLLLYDIGFRGKMFQRLW